MLWKSLLPIELQDGVVVLVTLGLWVLLVTVTALLKTVPP